MSKKNSSVNLKNIFTKNKDFRFIYSEVKKKLENNRKKIFLVGISGGPDSLALAAITKTISLDKKFKFYYALVNHNIRKNSKQEAQKVKKLLKKFDINLNILTNKSKINKNIQSQARQIRYKLLEDFCHKNRINIVLTAHNLEDQVETFFIRLSRGSGLTGLSGMMPIRSLNRKLKLVRPLIDTKKLFLIKISNKVFGKFFLDPSNKDTKYLRTKIRNLKKPLLKSGINYDQIIKSIKNLASSKATLDQYLKNILKEVMTKSKEKVLIKSKKFYSFNNEIKIKIINEAIRKIKKNYYNPRSKKVASLIANLGERNFKKATLAGCLIYKQNDQICLKKE